MSARLVGIELEGFRGFVRPRQLNLDAEAVLLVGRNGYGKTSLLDAILWGITGVVPRLEGGEGEIVSLYAPDRRARVLLHLRTNEGVDIRIERVRQDETQTVAVDAGDQHLEGREATNRLMGLIWEEAFASSDPDEALISAITRSVYLQQDSVRHFLTADSEGERFTAVSELVGAGRINELQIALDREKTAWTRETNELRSELTGQEQRVAELEDQVQRLSEWSPELDDQLSQRWSSWWDRAEDLGASRPTQLRITSADASPALESAIQFLGSVSRSARRRSDRASSALEYIEEYREIPDAEVDDAAERVRHLESELESAQERLSELEDRAAEVRRRQVEAEQGQEQLRSLARLALRHLGDECPVCAQEYDRPATIARLERIAGGDERVEPDEEVFDQVADQAQTVQDLEQELAAERADLRRRRGLANERNQLWQRVVEAGEELDVTEAASRDASELADEFASIRDRSDESANRASGLASEGEGLTTDVRRAAELERLSEIREELEEAQAELRVQQSTIDRRGEAGDLAGALLEQLREATSEFVTSELRRIQPILQRTYATIDPHPTFRATRFLTRFHQRRGRLATLISDPASAIEAENPQAVLSSSQLNSLAVSIFVSLNLGLPDPPLECLVLDDPIQSLDDVNLLGLIDLLRRVKDRRQLVISTHDVRFGKLLARKLRPIGSQRTVVLEFESWTRDGPSISQIEMESDPGDLRVVA